MWAGVTDALDAPRVPLVERLLTAVGIAPDTARLVAVTPSLQLSWLTGTTVALLMALALAQTGERGIGLFLALAPVLPVAGVAVAFGPRTDPLHEVAVAAPYSSFRLLLLRSAAVLTTSLLLAVPAAALLPATAWVAAGWLLPALALTCTALALATRVDPVVSSAVLAGCWLLVALSGLRPERDPLLVAVRRRAALLPRPARPRGRCAAHLAPLAPRLREPRMTAPTVVVDDLDHSFGRLRALDGACLRARPGVTGLLGPNGAGKTTLLRVLATVLAPQSGRVRLLGLDPSDAEERREVRRRLGYLPQDPGYSRTFTAFELVDYVAVLKELTDRRTRHDEVRRVLELVDLTDVAGRKVKALSGGMRRRLGLAQALLRDPDLVVLDEPTVGLDPEQRLRFRDLVSRAGEDRTVVLSTHQTEDVAALCEHVVVVDRGRALFSGSVPDLVATAEGAVWLDEVRDPSALLAWRLGNGAFHHIGAAPSGASLVAPTLEDAYLLLLGDRATAAVPA